MVHYIFMNILYFSVLQTININHSNKPQTRSVNCCSNQRYDFWNHCRTNIQKCIFNKTEKKTNIILVINEVFWHLEPQWHIILYTLVLCKQSHYIILFLPDSWYWDQLNRLVCFTLSTNCPIHHHRLPPTHPQLFTPDISGADSLH